MTDSLPFELEYYSSDLHRNFSVFVLGNNTCRACLTQDEEMQSLFPAEELCSSQQQNDLLNMFLSCTALDVSYDDPYPKHICNGCFSELIESYSFWMKCRQSIEQLDSLTENNDDETEYKNEQVPISSNTDDNEDIDDYIKFSSSVDLNSFNIISAELGSCIPKSSHKPQCHQCQLSFSDRAEYKKHWQKNHRRQVQTNLNHSKKIEAIDEPTAENESFAEKDQDHNYECQELVFPQNSETEIEKSEDQTSPMLQDRLDNSQQNSRLNDRINFLQCSPDLNSFVDIPDCSSQNSFRQPRCHKCQMFFTNRTKYKVHWNKYHSKNSQLRSGSEKSETSPRKPACRKCQLFFPNKAEYKKHAKIHNLHLCPQCGHVSKSNSALREHFTTHTNLRPYKCTICNKTYKSATNLNVHKSTHIGVLKYACQHCDKKFVTWASRFSHIRTHHTVYDKHICEICSKGFPDANKLRIHIRFHTGEKPFACEDCEMAFKSSGELVKHKLKHSGIRNYSCTECGKRFLTSKHVKQHMVVHTGERKYKCEICGKGFTQSHVLRSHLKIHERQALIDNDLHNDEM
ncbi:zinc finger protein 721-like [Ctenocephalides felis]|uniref:zinc finger protein 721-like n=1 Tax=Ctenocephalides felis TaxID=7515 RepID=UPI000E6E3840|nr:zinc finger protein 721-like [Ctenocephalides felis]